MDSPELELVKRTAALARLEITDDEARTLAPQFARILEQFQALVDVDVEGVEPMTGATRLSDVTRADEPRPSLARDAALANAPDPRDGFYGVPKTIGGGS
jgi:aspartyl-tRNA(Asn)/glutamyl-tRNA(Gln) amidotransferase subunit C